MDTKILAVIVIVFGGSIVGIFWTKAAGFGRYTTSVLLLVLSLFMVSLALVLGKVDSGPFLSLLFAVVGYAGGLITANSKDNPA
jgi:hypothetical protein